MINQSPSVLLLRVFFAVLLVSTSALAQEVADNPVPSVPVLNVIHFFTHEKKSLELPGRSRGDITVHLASDGEMLNGYFISLIRLKDRKLIKTRKSDRNGVAVFNRIPPDDYSLLLRKSLRLRKENTVRIGDAVLTISGAKQERQNQDEYY